MFKGSVLILNKFWQPLYIVSMEEAVCILFQERGKILLEDFGLLDLHDWLEFSETIIEEKNVEYLMTPKMKLIKPYVVIMHNNSYQPRVEVSFSRKLIEVRDKNRCQYCGKRLTSKDRTIDHVIPKSRGGKNTWENVVLCCKKCNMKKGNKTPKEAGMTLLNEPRRPKLIEMIFKKFEGEPQFELWKKLLDKPY